MSMDTNYVVAWLVILVVMVLIEVVTMGLTTVWFAGGALVAALLAAFDTPLWVQVAAALIVSIALILTTRPIAVKYFNKDRVRTNAESLIGHVAIVIGEIDNIRGIGQVNVGGQEWSARSSDDGVHIPVGTLVEILNISGVKLIVRPSSDKA